MKGRKKVDTKHEDALVTVLQRFGLLSKDWPNTLQNIAIFWTCGSMGRGQFAWPQNS